MRTEHDGRLNCRASEQSHDGVSETAVWVRGSSHDFWRRVERLAFLQFFHGTAHAVVRTFIVVSRLSNLSNLILSLSNYLVVLSLKLS